MKDAAGVAFVGSSPTTATGSLATWNEPRALPTPGTRGHTADLTSARHQADGYRDGERAKAFAESKEQPAMEKRLLAVLNDAERLLVAETEADALAALMRIK